MTSIDRKFYRQCTAIVDRDNVVVDVEALRVYECDDLSRYRQMPRLVALPETIAQVQEQASRPVVHWLELFDDC